jgi:hypothetical protein
MFVKVCIVVLMFIKPGTVFRIKHAAAFAVFHVPWQGAAAVVE